MVEGIPDFRVDQPAWIDFEEDRQRARELAGEIAADDVKAAVEFVLRRREGWDDALIERRARQILAAPTRLSEELDGWLSPLQAQPGPLFDIGCGPGTLLAAAAADGRPTVGIDVSLEWLVVAQRMIRAAGGVPVLACALAEKLPLADRTVRSAAVLDVIEHVSDPGAVIGELDRVLAAGGSVALATPNRYSLSAEPHVGVWGVGWVPTRYQERFVQWRSGKPYGFVRLLSRRELVRLFERHSEIDVRVTPATVSNHELAGFTHRRARVARVYNRLASSVVSKPLVSPVSPFFHLVGYRRA